MLRSLCIHTFVAPVSASANTISLTGSWSRVFTPKIEDWLLSPTRRCHYRIHCWEHKHETQNTAVCLDWCVREAGAQLRFEIEVKFTSLANVSLLPSDFVEKINELLDLHRVRIRKLQVLFQHAHPGIGAVDSVIGIAGNDGASQSV